MENCLLCLEGHKDFVGCIKVNSEKWKQEDLEFLIEKYLWPIDSVKTFSWMCLECAQQLQDFHKFYMRVEQAHITLTDLVKTEDENPINNDLSDKESTSAIKEVFDSDDVNEYNFRIENVMEQQIPNKFEFDVATIKNENINEDLEKPFLKCRRKCINVIAKQKLEAIKDPLEKSKTCKQTKLLIKEKKLCLKTKKSRCSTKNVTNNQNPKPEIKHESEAIGSCLEDATPKNLINPNEEDDAESDGNDRIKSPKSKNTKNNPDEKTLKEYDRVIAENLQIVCSICQISFENFLALRKHFKMEHKQRGYARCCNRNFFTRSVLVDHIFVHLNPEHFKCQECGKVFSDRRVLLNHLKLHEEDDSKLKKCNQCGKAFVNSAALKNHLLTHSSQKMCPCTICGKFFTNSSILNHHIEAVHQNKFILICEVCGKSIRCPTAFASHKEAHEVKTTPIGCDVCGLLLSNKMGLKRHKSSQHPEGGKKEHKCHICSKISPTLRALKTHIRRTHEMGHDYKCSLCEKAFKRPSALKEHMATHTGTPLYSCPWCPKTFISNGNMYNHRKNAHPKEWEELQRQKYIDNVT